MAGSVHPDLGLGLHPHREPVQRTTVQSCQRACDGINGCDAISYCPSCDDCIILTASIRSSGFNDATGDVADRSADTHVPSSNPTATPSSHLSARPAVSPTAAVATSSGVGDSGGSLTPATWLATFQSRPLKETNLDI